MNPFSVVFYAFLLMVVNATAQAAEVKIAVGLALPPYVLSESDSGMEMEIVKEALAFKGHTLKVVYLPFMRVAPTLEKGAADAALTVNESSGMKNVHYSDVHITYQNVAVGLARNGFSAASIMDLGQHSIIAFQNATKYLGSEFAAMAAANKKYSERAQQDKQIVMLYSGRTDLVVMDINIYKYYKKLESRVATDAAVDIFEVFPPTDYKVAFREKSLKDDFNAGLQRLRDNGRYQAIIEAYIK